MIVKNNRWLISWIGDADHAAFEKEGSAGIGVGPIATALLDSVPYDKVCLLTNYPHSRSSKFCDWLEAKTSYAGKTIDLQELDLVSPINYASIYDEVSKHLKALGLPRENVDLTFHLSPGTPAMAAIWIMLAKTRFPASLIQTSKKHGFESVDFNFDLANDFLPEFLKRSDQRIERLIKGPKETLPHFGKIIYRSEAVKNQILLAQRFAVHDIPVLILGETGTGKELFAEAIRDASDRAEKPFVIVNCGAIAPELANSELFGHVKGAFTGASINRKGHFQEANGGTLFLDEVGDLPKDAQVRLLRALQAKEVTPVGESKPVKVDVRIIAATHRDLAVDVANGHFREDLFHRLAVGILQLPPLRERDGDVDLLIDRFLDSINSDAKGKPEAQFKKITNDARKILITHSWPGNIRELYHTLLRASIWSTSIDIKGEDVSKALLKVHKLNENVIGRPLTGDFDLQKLLDEVSSNYILRALKQTGGRKTFTANILGFSNHQTLKNWMKRLKIDAE
jgi:DNA-binding NtrC family response regulator